MTVIKVVKAVVRENLFQINLFNSCFSFRLFLVHVLFQVFFFFLLSSILAFVIYILKKEAETNSGLVVYF